MSRIISEIEGLDTITNVLTSLLGAEVVHYFELSTAGHFVLLLLAGSQLCLSRFGAVFTAQGHHLLYPYS